MSTVTRRGFLGGLVSAPVVRLRTSPELVVTRAALDFDRGEMDARAKRDIAALVQDVIMRERTRGLSA